MNTARFFEYGCPDEFGKPHYGLYQPALDRIVFTVDDLEIAQEIVLLMSSRFNLFIYDLSGAENYSPNIIDNTCCENWSVSNCHEIKLTHSHREIPCMDAEVLLPKGAPDDWILDSDKDWMQSIWHWVRFQFWLETEYYVWFPTDVFIHDIDPSSPGNHGDCITLFGSRMRRCLYLEREYDLANGQILALIQSENFLCRAYQRWLKR